MKLDISAGSPMEENTRAWCEVDLGKMYFKTGDLKAAQASFEAALRYFPSYHTKLWRVLRRSRLSRRIGKAAIANMRLAQQATPMPDYAAALYGYKPPPRARPEKRSGRKR